MRSIPHALIWELFARGRWVLPGFFLLGNLLPLLLYGYLSRMTVDPTDSAWLVLHFTFVPILLFQFAIGIVGAQGTLSRLYTAPIPTTSLVAWHMFPGAFLLGLEMVVAAWIYNTLFHVGWPIWGPALFAAAAWSAVQLVVCVSHRTASSYCFAGAPCIGLWFWLQSRYGPLFSMPRHYWYDVTASETLTLLIIIGISFVLTVAGVARDRRGERLPSLGLGDCTSTERVISGGIPHDRLFCRLGRATMGDDPACTGLESASLKSRVGPPVRG